MCGKINALDLCEGVMRELLLDPGLTVKPAEQVEHIPPQGKCMVVPGRSFLLPHSCWSTGWLHLSTLRMHPYLEIGCCSMVILELEKEAMSMDMDSPALNPWRCFDGS